LARIRPLNALRKWRLGIGLDKYREVGKDSDGGIKFYSYNLSFNDSFTDEEIDKGFQMTQALGTSIITASSPLSVSSIEAVCRKV
jgi:hypothetical protein